MWHILPTNRPTLSSHNCWCPTHPSSYQNRPSVVYDKSYIIIVNIKRMVGYMENIYANTTTMHVVDCNIVIQTPTLHRFTNIQMVLLWRWQICLLSFTNIYEGSNQFCYHNNEYRRRSVFVVVIQEFLGRLGKRTS